MIAKVLVANRGEIACRIIRTCRRLGLATVAIHSDVDASAPHVGLADEAVCVGRAPVKDSYLAIDAVLAAARETCATAIHPGYGLLSESAEFAARIHAAGIVFVGPSPSVLEVFGDKVRARKIAKAAAVSPLSGTDEPLVPSDPEAVTREAARIGYPVLVKAVGGGGGIGMQVVPDEGHLMRAVRACSDRARAAFGDDRVYLERYVERPRHIEVQVLCDGKGRSVALGERECSVQRRHQKLVEETPSPASFLAGPEGDARRRDLCAAALRIVDSVGYAGAGTVEFLGSQEGDLYFLEVNARLQVEHRITELVTGLDLVEQQLRIAFGEPLAIGAIEPRGHAIEARIYAEDPARRFAPQPGRIERLVFPEEGPSLRIDSGVTCGSEVTTFYDPLLAKVVAHGGDRASAIARLRDALLRTQLEIQGPAGPATTNLAFLRGLLEDPSFLSGCYDTHLAERLAKA